MVGTQTIGAVSYTHLYLEGFDYKIGDVTVDEDKGVATAEVSITCKSMTYIYATQPRFAKPFRTEVVIIHGIDHVLPAETVTAADSPEILIQIVIHTLIVRNQYLIRQRFIPLGFNRIQAFVSVLYLVRNGKIYAGQLILRIHIFAVVALRTVKRAVHFQLDGFKIRLFAVQRAFR